MQCVFADGKDWKEDLLMFKILNSINELDIIAIPYCFGNRKKDEFKRPYFLDMIEKEVNPHNINHKIHLFGCNSFPNIKKENKWWVDTMDGTMPWKCGYMNKLLPLPPTKEPKRPEKYFDIKPLTLKQKKNIQLNCEIIKRECEYGKGNKK
jgi:hypothetical protein